MITFRYASNIATGRGFVFNEGERVLGTTTPLQTLLLAAVGVGFGPNSIPPFSTILMSLCGLGAGVGNFLLLRRIGYCSTTCALGMFIFLANGRVMQTSIGGMETPLVVGLMCLGAYGLIDGRDTLVVVSSCLLALTRPDGLLWGGLMIGALVLTKRRVPQLGIVIGGALIVGWLAFAYYYFGSPVPQSIIAKRAILSSLAGHPWWMFLGWYMRCWSVSPSSPTFPLWAFAFALGARSLLRPGPQRPLGLVLVAYPFVYGVVLFAGHAPEFGWYRTPPMWVCLLVISIGLGEIAKFLAEKAAPRLKYSSAMEICAAGLMVVYLLVQHDVDQLNLDRRYQENEEGGRKAVGLWLTNHSAPAAIVAMEAIGYQGYYSERRVIDLAGLVSPYVVSLKRASSSNAEVFHKIVSEAKPDYIVLRSFEVEKNQHFHGGLLFADQGAHQYFDEHYCARARFVAPHPEDWGALADISVYGRCKD